MGIRQALQATIISAWKKGSSFIAGTLDKAARLNACHLDPS